ncbi:hypothetical protein D3C80_1721080 [compost metagenome]
MGELLRQESTPRDTEDVNLVITEMVQHPCYQRSQPRKAVRQRGYGRTSYTRCIKQNDLLIGIQGLYERRQQLHTRADSVEQHQRGKVWLTFSDGDP